MSTNRVNATLLSSGILHVSLNRPDQLNALSMEVLQHLKIVFSDAKMNKKVKAVLLSGEGKVFCAGADIKQLADLNGTTGLDFAHLGQTVFRQLELLGKPSLAAVHGVALGGGCELAMAATLRFCISPTIFGQPEIKLGVIPGFGGTQRLSRLIGKGRALEICLTGRRFSAEEAFQWGLVNEIVKSDLVERAKSFLSDLIQMSPIALQSIIATIQQGYDLPLDEANELEAAYFGLCCSTANKREGVSAFLEKRTPVFSGE